MKSVRRYALTLLTILAASPVVAAGAQDLHAMLPDRIKQSGILTIVTDAHHPPNESYAQDGKTVVGFEPDVWNALAQRLGVKTKVVSIDFDGLIPGVQAGRFDVAFESLSDSPTREQQVTFIDFARASAALFTLASNTIITTDPMTLCGLKGGAQAGTDFATSIHALSDRCAKAGKAAIDVKEFASDAASVMALYAQRVDFALNDHLAAKKLTQFAPRPVKLVDIGLPRFIIGAVVRHDDKKLAEALLAGFKRMHDDGSYAAIVQKWQIQPLALDKPGFDLASGKS